jgi:RNA polymerase sigma factor (sigma-70 family)
MSEIAAQPPPARVPGAGLRLLGDDRLCRLAAAGDSRAFALIYERHHQALYRYCRSILGDPDDAADALQSTLTSALRGLVGETRDINLKPWLFRIAHNECVSLLRRRRPQVAIDESLELEAPPGADPATRERLRQLVADLRELPDAQRGALVMRELSGLRYEEIAAVLGGTVATARQAVFEARSALHELAEGRAMDCEAVRRTLSDDDRRKLRGRKLRAHLRACGSCRDFGELIGSRRRDLAAVAPPLPAAMAAGLLHNALAGGGTSASGGGSGVGSLMAGKAVAASTALKTAAIVAATAAAGAGAARVAVHHSHRTGPAAVDTTWPVNHLVAPPAHAETAAGARPAGQILHAARPSVRAHRKAAGGRATHPRPTHAVGPSPLAVPQQPAQSTPAAPEHQPKPNSPNEHAQTPAKPTTPPRSQQGLQHSQQGKGQAPSGNGQDDSNSHVGGAGQSDAVHGQAGTTGPHGDTGGP